MTGSFVSWIIDGGVRRKAKTNGREERRVKREELREKS
jgi:hypothetical protein